MVTFNDLLYVKIVKKVNIERTKVREPSSHTVFMLPYVSDPLLDAIKRQSIAFGDGVDDMAHLCEWIVDEPGGAEDDPDHWMNLRPY